jgi:hypothetical protein
MRDLAIQILEAIENAENTTYDEIEAIEKVLDEYDTNKYMETVFYQREF